LACLGRLPDTEIYKFGKEVIKEVAPKKPPPKGAKNVVEPEVVEDKWEEVTLEEMESMELPTNRIYQTFPVIYNFFAMNHKALQILPAPDFPDPQSLPIPEPELHQI